VAAAAPADTRANQIGLGATITPDGKIVSIGGIAPIAVSTHAQHKCRGV
jgi:hypothetical protein